MRDIKRINPFLKKVEELWLLNPDLRFGQIIYLLANSINRDLFFPEETEWLEHINKEIQKGGLYKK